MSVVLLLVDVLMLTATVAVVRSSRMAWRNEHPWLDPDLPRVWWYGGRPSWRGWVRTQSVVAPAVFVVAAPLFVVGSTGVSGGAFETVEAVAGLLLCAIVVVGARVWLFNRPKWLVAPHLRHQPGMLAELGGERCQPTPTPQPRRRRGLADEKPMPSPPPDA